MTRVKLYNSLTHSLTLTLSRTLWRDLEKLFIFLHVSFVTRIMLLLISILFAFFVFQKCILVVIFMES